jgi:hypothetical protein
MPCLSRVALMWRAHGAPHGARIGDCDRKPRDAALPCNIIGKG